MGVGAPSCRRAERERRRRSVRWADEPGHPPAGVGALDLDLDVFSGPFDLLLTLVLREEVDLLELELAEVVLAYLDHLERSGELDLESATEFIVLIAALLELKSRLMLTGEDEQLLDLEPGEAAEELLARMLDARRYRAAGEHLAGLLAAEHGVRFREAPLPPELRRTLLPAPDGSQDPDVLGAGDRAPAGDAAGDRRAPHRRPAGQHRRAPGRTCAGCCGGAASASRRPSAAPTG